MSKTVFSMSTGNAASHTPPDGLLTSAMRTQQHMSRPTGRPQLLDRNRAKIQCNSIHCHAPHFTLSLPSQHKAKGQTQAIAASAVLGCPHLCPHTLCISVDVARPFALRKLSPRSPRCVQIAYTPNRLHANSKRHLEKHLLARCQMPKTVFSTLSGYSASHTPPDGLLTSAMRTQQPINSPTGRPSPLNRNRAAIQCNSKHCHAPQFTLSQPSQHKAKGQMQTIAASAVQG